ncbi:hypothetical protein QBC43DRAFT_323594 [Cladorrhinum sp. PSN259]|nr:hypothetical protein QBC43DRAFT_323594 [Cladorrhinum sp. PSN259]
MEWRALLSLKGGHMLSLFCFLYLEAAKVTHGSFFFICPFSFYLFAHGLWCYGHCEEKRKLGLSFSKYVCSLSTEDGF